MKFRVELVWTDADNAASSIFLTADGRVILQGDMISVDRNLIRAIKDML